MSKEKKSFGQSVKEGAGKAVGGMIVCSAIGLLVAGPGGAVVGGKIGAGLGGLS